jgi:hypothetical protein
MRWQLVESAAAPVRPTGLRPALDQGIHGSVWHMAFLRSGGGTYSGFWLLAIAGA